MLVAHCMGGSKVLVLLFYQVEQTLVATSIQCTQLYTTAVGTLLLVYHPRNPV